MSLGDGLVSLAALAFAALAVFLVPKIWRNEAGFHSDTLHPAWPWGRRLWRACVRVPPLTLPMFVLAAIALPADAVGSKDSVLEGVAVIAGSAAAVFGLLIVPVMLFNRPKWAVAPHHRHQRGLLAELGGKRSAPTEPPARMPRWYRERIERST